MMKPVVNEDLCIGCGHCIEVCPQVFELENEKSQFSVLTSAARAAARRPLISARCRRSPGANRK